MVNHGTYASYASLLECTNSLLILVLQMTWAKYSEHGSKSHFEWKGLSVEL